MVREQLETYRRAVADAFVERLEATVAEAIDRWQAEIPELSRLDEAGLWESSRQMTVVTWTLQSEHVRINQLPEDFGHDAAIAAANAASGMKLATIVRIYHIGCTVSSRAWMSALASVPGRESVRAEAGAAIASLISAYNLQLMAAVQDAHDRGRNLGSAETWRSVAVQSLLGGSRDTAPELGFPLERVHFAVVIWGEQTGAPVKQVTAFMPGASLATEAISAGPVRVWWLWICPDQAVEADPVGAFRQFVFDPPDGYRLSVGELGSGVEGFRESHRQAARAYPVGDRLGQPVTLYRDCTVETLALREEDAWLRFAERELRGFDGDDVRSSRLRRTLRSYFASDQNAASAGAAMGLHEGTVARHLRAVEELIGCPVAKRRIELELALRIRDLHGGDPRPASVTSPARSRARQPEG